MLISVHYLQGPSGSANFPTTLSAMYPAMYTSTFSSWSKAGDDHTEGLVSRSRTTLGGSMSEVLLYNHCSITKTKYNITKWTDTTVKNT